MKSRKPWPTIKTLKVNSVATGPLTNVLAVTPMLTMKTVNSQMPKTALK